MEASQFIETIEAEAGPQVACLEEDCSWKRLGKREEIINKVGRYSDSNYGRYVNSLLDKVGVKINIPVTKPSLPPLDEVVELLSDVGKVDSFTNGGPQHTVSLRVSYPMELSLGNLSLCSNGTLALILALQGSKVMKASYNPHHTAFAATRNVWIT